MDIYDKQGKEIDTLTFASLFENLDYKRIGHDVFGDFSVSTVWLGINHNYGSGPPLIFETMVFDNRPEDDNGGSGGTDVFCDRYPTEDSARLGHARVVNQVQRGTLVGYGGVIDTGYQIEEWLEA